MLNINDDAFCQLFCGDIQAEPVNAEPFEEVSPHRGYCFKNHSKSSSQAQQITLYSGSSQGTLRGRTFKELHEQSREIYETISDSDGLWWLNLQCPTESDIRLLCAALHVHPLTVEDILAQETREKVEDYTTYYFACFWSCQGQGKEDTFNPCSIYMIVFPTGAVTITFDESDHPARVLRRIELLDDYVSPKSDWFFYAFIDDIVDSFFPWVALVEKRVDEIEDQVYTTRAENTHDFLAEIELTRKTVSSLTRLLYGKTSILSTFEKRHCEHTLSHEDSCPGRDLQLYIADVQDHVVSILSKLGQFDSLLNRSQGNFVAALSSETIRNGQTTNKFLGQVAVLSMIFTLLLLVCGMFSTNVNAGVPLYASDEPEAWFIIVGGDLILTVLLWYTARRLKWC